MLMGLLYNLLNYIDDLFLYDSIVSRMMMGATLGIMFVVIECGLFQIYIAAMKVQYLQTKELRVSEAYIT